MNTDSWFAGFVDGEGSFFIRRVGQERHWPAFGIQLTAADTDVLRKIQEAFGGSLGYRRPVRSQLRHSPGQKACMNLQIGSVQDMLKLVHYFDRFPLRSKKAVDYSIWREAVLFLARPETSSRGSLLRDLKARLTILRTQPEAQ